MTRRAGARPATSTSPPISLVASSLLRWSWAIALVGICGALSALVLGRWQAEQPVAHGRVGLTTATEWPLYDAYLDRFLTAANDDQLQSDVREQVGDGSISFSTELVSQAYIVEITATGQPDLVESAVELLMDAAVGSVTDVDAGAVQAELVSAQLRQTELVDSAEETERSIDRNEVELVAISALLDEDWNLAGDTERTLILEERRQLIRTSGSVASELAELDEKIADLTAELEPQLGQLQVIRPSALQDDAGTGTKGPLAAGVGLGIIACALAVWLDRERGSVRGAWQIEELLETSVIAQVHVEDAKVVPPVADLLARVVCGASEDDDWSGFVCVPASEGERQVEIVANAVITTYPEPSVDDLVAPLDLSAYEDGIVLVGIDKASMGDLRRVLAGLRRMGVERPGVILIR